MTPSEPRAAATASSAVEAVSHRDAPPSTGAGQFTEYLVECREAILEAIRDLLPQQGRCRPILYDLMLEYPLRQAKALRPALCLATCAALGGRRESVLPTAAALELYHNAFLIHDDVEDGSESRRDGPTLHRRYGMPIAVNVGDAMLAMTLEPLLDNVATVGVGKALRILQTVARMARESAEGQAIELDWIRRDTWDLVDADYVRMVHKKTSWYTFVTPLAVGALVADATPAVDRALRTYGSLLGVAFQIQDDVLNLVTDTGRYGKELAGDLWEGKRTLILLHVLRAAGDTDRARALAILAKPHPALAGASVPPAGVKTEDDVTFLLDLVRRHGSIDYARGVATRWAHRARAAFARVATVIAPSIHRDFLESIVAFVVQRDH
jgi:geranylgeranyl diphosphate synthase type II